MHNKCYIVRKLNGDNKSRTEPDILNIYNVPCYLFNLYIFRYLCNLFLVTQKITRIIIELSKKMLSINSDLQFISVLFRPFLCKLCVCTKIICHEKLCGVYARTYVFFLFSPLDMCNIFTICLQQHAACRNGRSDIR